MKVAIVTIIEYFNHGNRLQNYALAEKIKSLGYEVETLGVHAKRGFHAVITIARGMPFFKFVRRINNNIKLTKKSQIVHNLDYMTHKDMHKLSENYDAVVIGSDQVWNPFFLDYPCVFFGMFAASKKCMSYSASFGISELPKNKLKTYEKGLSHIPYISVREDDGKKIIDDLFDGKKECKVVLDPTLLLTREEWLERAIPFDKKPKQKYILTYFVAPKAWQKKYVKKLAKETGRVVVNCNRNTDKCFCNTFLEYIDLLNNADLVCTNSFHGHALSIALNKPFISFASSYNRNSRISTLLRNTNLEDRNYQKVTKENCFTTDYSEANAKLNELREDSFEFLKDTLEKITKDNGERND